MCIRDSHNTVNDVQYFLRFAHGPKKSLIALAVFMRMLLEHFHDALAKNDAQHGDDGRHREDDRAFHKASVSQPVGGVGGHHDARNAPHVGEQQKMCIRDSRCTPVAQLKSRVSSGSTTILIAPAFAKNAVARFDTG